MVNKKKPERTCIACNEQKEKKELLRIVKSKDGVIEVDETGKKSGRGAYICTSENCVKKLKKVKLLDKIFSTPVPDEIYIRIEEELLGKK